MTTKYSVQAPGKHAEKGITTNFFIRIEEGPYKGVEYTYTKVKDRGVEGDELKLNFEYDVLSSPIKQVVQVEFEAVLWDILKEILIEAAENLVEESEVVEIDELEDKPLEFMPEEIYQPQKPESD